MCYGNMCRSPMAEGLAKDMIGPGVKVESAGTNTWQGYASSDAIKAMQKKGIDISGHRAKSVDDLDLSSYDYIIAMDSDVAQELRYRYPELSDGLVEWEIEDPIGQALVVYEEVADKIHSQVEKFVETLKDKT